MRKSFLQPNEIIKDDKEILNLKNEIVELKDFFINKDNLEKEEEIKKEKIIKKKKKLKKLNY